MRVHAAFVLLSLQLVAHWPTAVASVRADEVVEDTVVAEEERSSADPDARTEDKKPTGQARTKHWLLDPALELADPRTYRLKVMIRIEAAEAPVRNVIAIGPVPMDWPEQ